MPFNIKNPKTNDWGTFLCSSCLNSELKIEALNSLNLLPPVSLEDDLSDLSEHYQNSSKEGEWPFQCALFGKTIWD